MKKETKKKVEPSQEFIERSKVIELKEKLAEKEHGFRMKELEMIRATEILKHERSMERQRIKSAEIRKNMLRKDAYHR